MFCKLGSCRTVAIFFIQLLCFVILVHVHVCAHAAREGGRTNCRSPLLSPCRRSRATLYLLIQFTSLTAASSYLVLFKASYFVPHHNRKANRTLGLKYFSCSQNTKQCFIVIVLWLIKLYLHKEGNRTCLNTNLQVKLQSEQPLRSPRAVFF